MRISEISQDWREAERLIVIGWISAYMRWRSMQNLPSVEIGEPTAETIMVIATSSPEFLNQCRAEIGHLLDKVETSGIRPMTGNECEAEFLNAQTARLQKEFQ